MLEHQKKQFVINNKIEDKLCILKNFRAHSHPPKDNTNTVRIKKNSLRNRTNTFFIGVHVDAFKKLEELDNLNICVCVN